MRLHSVCFKDFRSYREAEISGLGPMNFIAGLNGSGKSSILDAIAVGLTGECQGAEKGRGQEDLRRLGSPQKWEIGLGLSVADGGEIYAIRRKEGEGPRSESQKYVDSWLSIPAARIRACLYSGELLRLERKEAQKLILDLCDQGVEVSEALRGALARQLKVDVDVATLGAIENLYKRAYELRREAGRDVEAADVAAPAPPQGMEQLAGQPADAIEGQLSLIGQKLSELRGKRDEAKASLATLSQRAGELQRSINEIQGRITSCQGAYKALPSEEEIAQLDGLRERVAAIEKQAEEASRKNEETRESRRQQEKERSEKEAGLREQLATVRAKVTDLQIDIGSLDDIKGSTCPTCKQKVSAAAREKTLKALLEEKQQEARKADELEQKLQECRAEKLAPAHELPAIESPTPLRQQIARLEGGTERRKELADSIRALDDELQATRQKLTKANTDTGGERDTLTATLAELDNRIAKGETLKRTVTEYQGAMRTYVGARGSGEAARKTHAELEWIVGELGPNGIRKQLAGTTEKFAGELNALLAPLGFQVDLAPLLALDGDARVNGIPTRMLSASQKARFSIAFQIALATWSGLGLVVVDEWEQFDSVWSPAIQQTLAGSGHQVVIFSKLNGTREAFWEKAARAAGISFYLVEQDGDGHSQVEALVKEMAA